MGHNNSITLKGFKNPEVEDIFPFEFSTLSELFFQRFKDKYIINFEGQKQENGAIQELLEFKTYLYHPHEVNRGLPRGLKFPVIVKKTNTFYELYFGCSNEYDDFAVCIYEDAFYKVEVENFTADFFAEKLFLFMNIARNNHAKLQEKNRIEMSDKTKAFLLANYGIG